MVIPGEINLIFDQMVIPGEINFDRKYCSARKLIGICYPRQLKLLGDDAISILWSQTMYIGKT
jgi:hypothetical protein